MLLPAGQVSGSERMKNNSHGTHLADDRPAQADDHPSADDLGTYNKVPRLVEQRTEAREIECSVLLRADA